MQLIEEKGGRAFALASKEVRFFGGIRERILSAISKKPYYPKQSARRLGINEQLVYYHARKLESKGIIRVVRKEEHGNAIAKIYSLSAPSFFARFQETEPARKISINTGLEPFVADGRLNASIVVGSPDPHGPERARGRDAYYAIDLALFLGTFLVKSSPAARLDTDVHADDLKNNLILVGGPVINRVTKMINEKMQTRFDRKKNIFSSRTGKTYKGDECGIVAGIKNPFDREKRILVLAGRRYQGTRAAILAFMQSSRICGSHVVEGVDEDGDGNVDSARVVE